MMNVRKGGSDFDWERIHTASATTEEGLEDIEGVVVSTSLSFVHLQALLTMTIIDVLFLITS